MRITVIGAQGRPVTPVEDRKKEFERWAYPETTVEMVQCSRGPLTIETIYDVTLAAPNVVVESVKAEGRGSDAVIISCFADPGLFASREAVSIPVVGAGESAMLAIQAVGYRFSIVVPVDEGQMLVRRMAEQYGVLDRLASVRFVGMGVSELAVQSDRGEVLDRVTERIEACIREDGADSIVLGCGRFASMASQLSARVGVPVVGSRGPCMHFAQMLAGMGLGTSKKAYPSQVTKPVI